MLGVLAWRTFWTSDDEVAPSHTSLGKLTPPQRRGAASSPPAPAPPRPIPLQASELVREKAPPTLQPLSSVGPSDWHALSDDFRRIRGPRVRADWKHTESGDAWRVCGGLPLANEDCERLCERAGAMLLVSPSIAATLSSDLAHETMPAQRWLRYVHETHPALPDDAEEAPDDAPARSIGDLPGSSVRVCLACAALEAFALPTPVVATTPSLSESGAETNSAGDRDALAAQIADSLARLDRQRRAAPRAGATTAPAVSDEAAE